MTLLVASILGLTPVGFPEQPIAGELKRGEATYRAGSGLDRVFMEDRKAIGFWFDGRTRRDIEFCLWLSPGLTARWLGYLAAKEKWSPVQLADRWDRVRRRLDGRLSFVVRLAAFPKVDPFEQTPCADADPREIDQVRFLVTFDGEGLPLPPPRPGILEGAVAPRTGPMAQEGTRIASFPVFEARELVRTQARTASQSLQAPWYRSIGAEGALSPEFEPAEAAPGFPLGAYHAAWFLVTAPAPGLLPKTVQVRVFSSRKERAASFSLVSSLR
jgi:hypothetical protein